MSNQHPTSPKDPPSTTQADNQAGPEGTIPETPAAPPIVTEEYAKVASLAETEEAPLPTDLSDTTESTPPSLESTREEYAKPSAQNASTQAEASDHPDLTEEMARPDLTEEMARPALSDEAAPIDFTEEMARPDLPTQTPAVPTEEQSNPFAFPRPETTAPIVPATAQIDGDAVLELSSPAALTESAVAASVTDEIAPADAAESSSDSDPLIAHDTETQAPIGGVTDQSAEQTSGDDTATEEVTPPAALKQDKPDKGGGMRAVGIVGAGTILSRILGLAREMVFVALFSRTATDAFIVAFTIPNLLRRLLAEGILSTAFIPVFSGIEKQDAATRRRVYGAVLGLFSLLLIGVTIAGVFLSPWIVRVFAIGFSGAQLSLTIFLTQLMFPYLLLVGLASFWIAILHTRKSFAAPALGPVLLNVGMIACALLLHTLFSKSNNVAALAIGVLVGGILQLILQIVALARQQPEPIVVKPRWEPGHPAIREIALLMVPTLFGLGVYQLNVLLSRMFATMLPKGSATYIYVSDRIMELPLGVIAVAFATVNLPTLARQAEGERWDDFRDTLISGVRNVLYFCVPAGIALFVLREPVIMALFQRGRFSAHDVAMCAHVFMPAAFGLIFVAMLRNLTPGFYAYKDTKTPVKIAALSLLINAALSGLFAFALGLGAMGLTLANAVSALISVVLAIQLLHKRLAFDPEQLAFVTGYLPRILVSAGLMGMLLWLPGHFLPWSQLHILLKVLCIGVMAVVGGGVYFALTWHQELPEARAFIGRFGRILKRFKR